MSILCYHTVEPGLPSRVALEPAEFEAQMALLARTRRVVAPSEVSTRIDRRGRLPRGTAAVTFDDGLTGVLEHAAPVLQRHGIPAIVFVVAQTLTAAGQAVDWVDDAPAARPLPTLSADDLRALAAHGVSVGSHSWSHRRLPELSEAEVLADLRQSREVLEDAVGGPVRQLAYPRGLHAPHVRRAAQRAGHDIAYALPERREEPGLFAVPRVGVYPGNTLRDFRIKLWDRYLALRLSPASGAARALVRRARR